VPLGKDRVDPVAARTKLTDEPTDTATPNVGHPVGPSAQPNTNPPEHNISKPENSKEVFENTGNGSSDHTHEISAASNAKTSSEDRKNGNARRDVTDLGRGGEQHRAIQQRIKQAGEENGFRAIIEKEILNGGSHIDVVLERAGFAWACQVGVTNTIDHEVGQVRNCVKAGYERIVVISTKLQALKKMESAVAVSLGAEVAKRVMYFLPDAFISELPRLITETIPTQTKSSSHGWVVTSETVVLSREETKAREEKALRTLAAHEVKRRKKKK
jgi:hypothetical protein